MEELLIVVLQLVVELILNIALYVPSDWLLWLREKKTDPSRRMPDAWVIALGGSMLGAVVAGASLLIYPTTFLKHEHARVLNLAVAPLACALIAWAVARSRTRRGATSNARLHFWFALVFSAALVLVRFVWAERPAARAVDAVTACDYVRGAACWTRTV